MAGTCPSLSHVIRSDMSLDLPNERRVQSRREPCRFRVSRPSAHNIRAVWSLSSSVSREVKSCKGTAEEVASAIRRSREDLGLTQYDLAERMQATQSAVARWEGGGHEVTMRTLARIADALGVEFVVHIGGGKANK